MHSYSSALEGCTVLRGPATIGFLPAMPGIAGSPTELVISRARWSNTDVPDIMPLTGGGGEGGGARFKSANVREGVCEAHDKQKREMTLWQRIFRATWAPRGVHNVPAVLAGSNMLVEEDLVRLDLILPPRIAEVALGVRLRSGWWSG